MLNSVSLFLNKYLEIYYADVLNNHQRICRLFDERERFTQNWVDGNCVSVIFLLSDSTVALVCSTLFLSLFFFFLMRKVKILLMSTNKVLKYTLKEYKRSGK